MSTKKTEQGQFEQSSEFQNLKVAMTKILAVPKDELVRREEAYQKTRKQRSRTARTKTGSRQTD